MTTLDEWLKLTLAFCPEGASISKFLGEAIRRDKWIAFKIVEQAWGQNRLIVSHEDGHTDTITNIEVDPAGNLVIWLEA